ncbi:hypothetical protein B7Z17_01605, partial [Candidatus Saccharibacteria bacterium 32-49-10]
NTVGQPDKWQASRWGNNAAQLTHRTDGYTGNRSFMVTMSTRTDGDAKWMHEPVSVQPSTEYTYTSWYKSNIATEIDLQYIDVNGNVTYAYVATVAPSAQWKQLTSKFTTPANAAKVTVMHIVAAPGWLQTDDFVLLSASQTTPPVVTPPTEPVTPPSQSGNLIANNSFETTSGTAPVSWYKNSWGSNVASFSYENTGRTGGKSAKVSVTSYASGDAKWYAEPVAVSAGKTYNYSDYYKSTVPTRVVVAFADAQSNYSYVEINGAPASPSAWAQYKDTFVAPATATKASVYHVIDRVGSLAIDDVSLSTEAAPTAPTTPPVVSSVIKNSSLETANGTMPANWQTNSWGSNQATHQYVNEGRTGTKSVKVSVTNYIDGDAKWFFDPVSSINAGEQYRFTTWYKTNVTPRVVSMFIMANGTERYFGLPVAQPSGSTTQWQKYSDVLTIPEGAVGVSVFMLINQNGWLQTDDYELTPYQPVGFSRPLITMTFDDGHEDNATTALPILNQYGLKTTQCFATSFIEGKTQQVIDGVLAFHKSGHEVCSHTVSHPFLTGTSASNLSYELQHSQQYLQSITGQPVRNFASPYGDYDSRVVNEIKKYYGSHRSVDEGYNSKDNLNIYNLRVQNVLDTTSADQVKVWIEKARANNTWLILVYHRVAD